MTTELEKLLIVVRRDELLKVHALLIDLSSNVHEAVITSKDDPSFLIGQRIKESGRVLGILDAANLVLGMIQASTQEAICSDDAKTKQ